MDKKSWKQASQAKRVRQRFAWQRMGCQRPTGSRVESQPQRMRDMKRTANSPIVEDSVVWRNRPNNALRTSENTSLSTKVSRFQSNRRLKTCSTLGPRAAHRLRGHTRKVSASRAFGAGLVKLLRTRSLGVELSLSLLYYCSCYYIRNIVGPSTRHGCVCRLRASSA